MGGTSVNSVDREQLLDEVVAEYLEAADAGRAPERQEVLGRYPELAADLAVFFACQDEFQRLASPLRALAPASWPTDPVSGVAAPGTSVDPGHTGPYLPEPAGVQLSESGHSSQAGAISPNALTGPDRAPPDPAGATPRTTAELPVVSGYEVLEILGRGGMGVVYKARHLALKRLVALKMIRGAEHAGPEDLARFRTEAEAVARLQHPNIVQIYEVSAQGNRPFFALEFVDGGSLAARLAGRPQDPREAARLVETLARAMHAAQNAASSTAT